MTPCETEKFFAYLDGELPDGDRQAIESHIKGCAGCQAAIARRRHFLEAISRARPVITAPPELCRRVQSVLGEAPDRARFLARMTAVVRTLRWASPKAALAYAVFLAVIGSVWIERAARYPRSDFAVAALEAHQQRMDGGLWLAIRSSSAEAVSAWLQDKVPVHVTLPANDALPVETQPYQLEGASLVRFRGVTLGYVSYRVGGTPVSLLIAPASATKVAGRKQVRMKSLIFHYDSVRGFHVVTWTVPRKGVTYALVSNGQQHANASCIVCHAGPKDRAFMHALVNQ